MHTFRLHGLHAPEAAPRTTTATFGRRSPRRYARAAQDVRVDAPARRPAVSDAAGCDAVDVPQWVDQDFEEAFFE